MNNKKLFLKAGFALGAALLITLTGCVGFVGGGYGGGGWWGGDDGWWGGGGGYDRGRDVHNYSQRGFASRAAAHPGGGGHAAKR
jgi:hypothetical protein